MRYAVPSVHYEQMLRPQSLYHAASAASMEHLVMLEVPLAERHVYDKSVHLCMLSFKVDYQLI